MVPILGAHLLAPPHDVSCPLSVGRAKPQSKLLPHDRLSGRIDGYSIFFFFLVVKASLVCRVEYENDVTVTGCGLICASGALMD